MKQTLPKQHKKQHNNTAQGTGFKTEVINTDATESGEQRRQTMVETIHSVCPDEERIGPHNNDH